MRSRRRLKKSIRKPNKLKKNNIKIEIESGIAREIGALIYFGSAVILGLIIYGKAGIVGDFLYKQIRLLFGVGIYAIPVLLILLGLMLFFSKKIKFDLTRYFGISLLVMSGLSLIHMRSNIDTTFNDMEIYGGALGFMLSFPLRQAMSDAGANVVLVIGFLIGILITFEISLKQIISLFIPSRSISIKLKNTNTKKAVLKNNSELNIVKPNLKPDNEDISTTKKTKSLKDIEKKLDIKTIKEIEIKKVDTNIIKMEKKVKYKNWELPSLDLLSNDTSQIYVSDKVLKSNAEKIREKLGQFGIDVSMKDVNIGPSVMQYTLKPHEGVKLTKITALKDDIALALAAKSIRIEAPIPGKALVGIEVPNEKRMVVHLRELLESTEFNSTKSKLSLAMGRDVSGAPIIDDLGAMPHLLIAGSTGSGKSVGMNAFLLSLLYQNSPEELKFIMIDPKRVELTSYNGIPHLLTPVITQADKAHNSLKWAVAEMNRRYQTFSEKGYRNIDEHNKGEKEKMHKIVIVIDELADLMMQSTKKETEALICRIAQMARAVGMHLILATQRPSVNVITGVIKANIPARIAFTVTTGIDSRTIIDSIGAEDLLGMGDMLYLPGNMSKPTRVQGVYVSSKEIERVTNRIKINYEPNYLDEIVSERSGPINALNNLSENSDKDALYNDALQIIKETGKASASLFQRRLSIGYARAARILDILEENGVIGPTNGAKPREIYIKD